MAKRLSPSSQTGYYGADGGIAPVFSCGAQPLAPSFLTGSGSHMGLWVSISLHVAALAMNITANSLFFAADRSTGLDLLWGWALSSIIGHTLAVVGTLVTTALIKDVVHQPLLNTLGFGLFIGSLVASGKISYAHSGLPADSAENVFYNLSLFFQGFGIASITANALCAASKKGGI